MKKILCIQLKQIGDVLMNTPAIRALSKQMDDAEIHFLTQRPSHLIFEHNPYVQKVIIFPKDLTLRNSLKFISDLRKEKYEIVIDFMGSPKTALIGWLSGASKRIGFDFRGRNIFYNAAVTPAEHLDYSGLKKAHLLSELGLKLPEPKLDFYIPESDQVYADTLFKRLNIDPKRPVISVSPVSRQPYKVWPAENFARVCDNLVEKFEAQILFLWGPGETHFIEDVRKHMKHDSLPDYDIPTIGETVGILEKVDLHLGNDNGPMHFAIAAGVPTFAIFGRPLKKNWCPPKSSKHMAIEFDPGCKNNCHYPNCKLECLTGTSPEMVIEHVSKLLT